MSLPAWIQNIQNSQRTSNRVYTLVIALMMACLGGTIAQLGARIDPSWDGYYLILVCFLISLEAVLTHHVSHSFYTHEKIGFRVAEWIGFAIVLRLLPYIIRGFDTFVADIEAWQANLVNLFSPEYLALLGLSFIVWRVSGDFANDFETLNAEITDLSYDEGKLDNRRSEARQHLLDRALLLGVLVALITVGNRLEMDIIWGERPLGPSNLLYLVAYFVLMLIMLSQSQFSVLRGQWLWHKITINPDLTHRWIQYAIFFILFLTVLALLLPTSYTLGLLESIEAVLNFIWNLIVGIFTLILLPFRWLLSLFVTDIPIIDQANPEPTETPTIPQPVPDGALPWLEVLKSIIFWVVLVGVVGYSLWFYLRRTPRLANFIGSLRPIGWLRNLWCWFRQQMDSVTRAAGAAVSAIRHSLRQRRTGRERPGWAKFNFKDATPRQQVMYFYLQMLDKAALRGLNRKPSQTPAQFEQTLVSTLQEVEPEVHGITQAFSEARYSRHPVESEQTSLVRKMWNRIMQAFKKKPLSSAK